MLITLIAVYFNLAYLKGLEIVILLFITDFIALWIYTELGRKDSEKNILLEKIKNLERLVSDVFNKINKKFSNEKNNKKELVEWLNKF